MAGMVAEGRTNADIAQRLGRSLAAVSVRLSLTGSARRPIRQWTPEERALLREVAPDHTSAEAAEILERTVGAVERVASEIGVRFKRTRRRVREPNRHKRRSALPCRMVRCPACRRFHPDGEECACGWGRQ